MHRSEAAGLVSCLNCGAEVSLGADRAFVLSSDSALCFACSLARHGAYDETHDTWTKAPDMAGLPLKELAP